MKRALSQFGMFLTICLVFASAIIGQENQYDFVVAKDGSGDFTTVQGAIDAVPDFRKNETTIYIKTGVYKEKLVLPKTKPNVTFIGEDVAKTILTYGDYASKKNIFGEEMGTTGSSSFFVYGDNFTAKNITFQNSAGPVGQAVAIRVDGDKAVFINCRFLGFQDTLYTHGHESRQYYKDCYIEGTVDFIFGASTAVFDDSEIYCKDHGYVTAAATDKGTEFGYVFRNCRITGDAPDDSFYLGRPWRPYAKVVFMNTFLGDHIKPVGWHNWGSEEKEKTAFYGEYQNSGPGFTPDKRVEWSHQLTDEEAKKYTIENIFNGWNPEERVQQLESELQ
ncbi:MAG: pectin esterase [Candidatus Marinimicrobia bacterium]|nr:pectin esterase [Candidatus Neomarinimicrobiota bacterium]MCF7827414.1 pectin esterase [Candidatus Neomarinimicrobiota bacterium]MCF7881353.1 pectin esterase [Candidatus Neomarinimicrobiota bacterium]